jgi:hypothetical protein
MEKNIKIVLNQETPDERVLVTLEDEFDNLEILSLKISSTDVYRKTSSDFGVIVGRVQTTNGYGLQNAKVSIFVPVDPADKERPEIMELYPFETVNDQFPNGVRYNLLPRVRNQNPSHRAVGNLPTINDLTHYPQYLEIMEKYYKYTTITNDSGDYMIFGVPIGSHNIMMDFDLFDTKSFEITANDLVETTTQYGNIKDLRDATSSKDNNNPNKVPNFIYKGNDSFDVEVKTNINQMPNIFNEIKQVNVASFWGDDEEHDVGITRCDFKINYKYTPTAVFFGWLSSVTGAFEVKKNYEIKKPLDNDQTEIPLELRGFDSNKGRDTGDIWPLQDLMVVIYRLDDKLTPGSRVRLGAFKSERGTGVFRISLPMYMEHYKLNQFGDLVPTDDTENGIPTKGYYAFEMYDISEAWQTRFPWGYYRLSPTPGIRVPSSVNGDSLTGGWEGTTTGLFEYDIINRKRKFYTIKTRYNKHKETNVSISGDYVNYLPQVNEFKDIPWNFPVDKKNIPQIKDVEVIGSAIIPKYEFDVDISVFDWNRLDDKDYNPQMIFPTNILNIIRIPKDLSYNEDVKELEYHLGIGVGLNGKNSGSVYTDIFRGDDFINGTSGENYYGDNPSFDFGDNSVGGLNLSLFAIELAKKPDATVSPGGTHRRYTQAYSDIYTLGPFISSTNYQNKFPVMEIGIHDITNDLDGLIDNRVYTSYGFYTGSIPPSSFNSEISNKYKANYYYFGLWDSANALKSIEKNYFVDNE